MATNTSTATSMCTYCSNTFNDPRMLNCLHSFCKECLDKYYDKQGKETSLNCPECSINTPLPAKGRIDLLPKDLRGSYEADIAKYESKVKSKEKIECDRCVDPENGPATAFCCDDCEFLCKVCYKDHKTWRKTLHHEVIMLTEKKKKLDILKNIPHAPMNCNVHPDSSLTFFCKTHRILTCRDCVLLDHKTCEYEWIEKVAENEKADLLSHLGNTQDIRGKLEGSMGHGEKVIQRVQATQKAVDDSIKSTFQALYECLRSREKQLLTASSDIALGKLTALQMQHEDMKRINDEVTSACIRVTSAAQEYTPAEMLSTKAAMTTKLEYLMKAFQETILEPCKSEIMPTSLDNAALLRDIQAFGQVIAGCCPSLSTATIEYIPKAVKDRERKFVIKACDAKGDLYSQGGEPVHATIRLMGSTDSPAVLAVTDNGDGTYSTSFTPTTIGEHVLSIAISNEQIRGSPFVVYVREPRDYTKLDASVQTFPAPNTIRGVAVDESGNVYITLDDHSILGFKKAGEKFLTIGTPGSNSAEDGKFYYPSEIALKGDLLYVVEESNHRIQKLSLSGEFVAKFGEQGSDPGKLSSPRGICISPEGKIFVTESSNHRVSVFTADGTFSYLITGKGVQGADMKHPCGIAIDPDGNLHVVQYGQNLVKVYTQAGEYLSQYGSGKLSNNPSGICIDEEGYSFVSNFGGGPYRMEVFDPEHKPIKTIPNLNGPWALTLDREGSLYVADRQNKRVLKY